MSTSNESVRTFSHVVGFDDGAFNHEAGSPVLLVGVIYSALRLEGVVSSHVEKDGEDANEGVLKALRGSRHLGHIQLLMFQGIAFGGFNVLDLQALHKETGLAILVVTRREPRMDLIKKALLEKVPGGQRKWELICSAGPMKAVGPVFAQWVGMTQAEVEVVVERFTVEGNLPEPLRVAHMVASGVSLGGSSRGP